MTKKRLLRGGARVLEGHEIDRVIRYINQTSSGPVADRLVVLLSYKAGLRVCEIHGLRVDDVLNASGEIGKELRVRADTAKGGRDRVVPLHPELRATIAEFMRVYPDQEYFAIRTRYRPRRAKSVNALTNWFHNLYKAVGLGGCSSHSGRRTFITQLARQCDNSRFTLRDVQTIAGHARLETTERYIAMSPRLHELVELLDRTSGAPVLQELAA